MIKLLIQVEMIGTCSRVPEVPTRYRTTFPPPEGALTRTPRSGGHRQDSPPGSTRWSGPAWSCWTWAAHQETRETHDAKFGSEICVKLRFNAENVYKISMYSCNTNICNYMTPYFVSFLSSFKAIIPIFSSGIYSRSPMESACQYSIKLTTETSTITSSIKNN